MSFDSDDDELNHILDSRSAQPMHYAKGHTRGGMPPGDCAAEGPVNEKQLKELVQWTTSDGKTFVPASHTAATLSPGLYEISHSPTIGLYFQKTPVQTEGLLRFPQTNSNKIIAEIQKFWDLEGKFREYKLAYKRGILMWGPPGSGKTCTIKLIMADVINRDGVVVKFTNPALFLLGMRVLRDIQPKTPVVVLMEDIDAIIRQHSESEVLQILDGVDAVDRIAFLASTNYPEELGARILNRPSRFDKRFKIDVPNAESRTIYFKHLIGEERIKELDIPLARWVEDTEGFSMAHMKELFIATVILGDRYEDAIRTLGKMKEKVSSEDDRERLVGFGGRRLKCED